MSNYNINNNIFNQMKNKKVNDNFQNKNDNKRKKSHNKNESNVPQLHMVYLQLDFSNQSSNKLSPKYQIKNKNFQKFKK